ncbi:peritrophin-1-like, partial [Pararge aegeria]|uniref:peritrophin-1-like n=1 Tax=Pararge aegeria TaxID=116150 RepID=UPI0019D0722F
SGIKVLPLLFLVSCVARSVRGSFEGVDPNTLSCDPKGQIFLLLPHFTDCTKFFMCAHGEEVLFSCPGGLYFDFVIQTCNWPQATDCILRNQESDEDIDNGSGEDFLSDKADLPYDGSINSLTGDGVANKIRPLNIEQPGKSPSYNTMLNCVRADDASRLVPYKGDCQRYWHCVSGVPQTAYCSDGLYFNEKTQQCDFEANVKCSVAQEDELNGEFLMTKKK